MNHPTHAQCKAARGLYLTEGGIITHLPDEIGLREFPNMRWMEHFATPGLGANKLSYAERKQLSESIRSMDTEGMDAEDIANTAVEMASKIQRRKG